MNDQERFGKSLVFYKIGFFVSLGIILILIVVIYLMASKDKGGGQSKAKVDNYQKSTRNADYPSTFLPSTKKAPFSKGLFYFRKIYTSGDKSEDGLFIYDLTKKTAEKVSNLSSFNTFRTVFGRIGKSRKIAFGKCEDFLEEGKCRRYSLNIFDPIKKEVKRVKLFSLSPEESIVNVGFLNEGEFVYIREEFRKGEMVRNKKIKWSIILVRGGESIVIDEIEGFYGGRHVGEFDDFNIEFSPDGQYVFVINTLSPQSITDHSIRIYKLDGIRLEEKRVIANATHPAWVSEKELVYVVSTDGVSFKRWVLEVYDVENKTRRELPGTEGWNRPIVSPDGKRVLLTEGYERARIGVYNLISGRMERIIEKAVGIKSVWLDEYSFLYFKGEKINAPFPFEYNALLFFDLRKGRDSEILGKKEIGGLISLY